MKMSKAALARQNLPQLHCAQGWLKDCSGVGALVLCRHKKETDRFFCLDFVVTIVLRHEKEMAFCNEKPTETGWFGVFVRGRINGLLTIRRVMLYVE